ncbi:RNA-binding transcriptional accessory protein [filamentous cyanobacterium LEGE 11480]|uniref:RNA-binding transcriptional accessory protein n=1 Tax=Romeriopsis navalis LEGE 11480 TaxID=2777977 RepID=A0A928Z4T4_9CYAN|nr:Tex family protein [Romeriopsis navalis]MBE9030723.1 RNA-binding transcriptional accessory protein [Romeriopsis navalis LEGE 11480]
MNIPQLLAQELSLRPHQVESALALMAEGATVPFIARYRKERTDSMDEVQLRNLFDRYAYLTELQDRKKTILESISTQGKLTPELQKQIETCLQKTDLEDLYLPYRPKRRTRATIAKERGLAPLATWLQAQNQAGTNVDQAAINAQAKPHVKNEKGLETVEAVLQGASDILAEAVSERAALRAYLRDYLLNKSLITASISAKKHPEGSTKFEMYRSYQNPTKSIPAHNLLALYRGEAEGIVSFNLDFDEDWVQDYLAQQTLRTKAPALRDFYRSMLKDAFNRLMKTSLINEVRAEKKQAADLDSIKTFETNLRELLLSAPAGMKPTLAIDPGFRTGCKVTALDQTGKFLEYQAIFPHTGKQDQAMVILKQLIAKHNIQLIAIGNGTASRETDEFVGKVLNELNGPKPIKVIVNESGASIYSASEVAINEFPDLDITVRGAISIGRRLQDPLAELVKIDPKSIGVGQYQHDVDQKLLKKQLDETIESCVNFVGVDLNTASQELLTSVSGINATVANNVVNYRNENGAFTNRKALLKVPKLGPKAFEQAAGFLRIRGGKNPLDNTAVHPERYKLVETIAKDLGVDLSETAKIAQQLQQNLQRYVSDQVGEPTLRDIVAELEKPGRDPRAAFQYATFREDIKEMRDLREGLELEGVVTNVANFGAFVDIGVHQDGLVHVSQLADRFVSDPKEIVKVGQVVKVRVLEVNEALKRISLSMRAPSGQSPSRATATTAPQRQAKPHKNSAPAIQSTRQPAAKPATLEDLKAKFGKSKR